MAWLIRAYLSNTEVITIKTIEKKENAEAVARNILEKGFTIRNDKPESIIIYPAKDIDKVEVIIIE